MNLYNQQSTRMKLIQEIDHFTGLKSFPSIELLLATVAANKIENLAGWTSKVVPGMLTLGGWWGKEWWVKARLQNGEAQSQWSFLELYNSWTLPVATGCTTFTVELVQSLLLFTLGTIQSRVSCIYTEVKSCASNLLGTLWWDLRSKTSLEGLLNGWNEAQSTLWRFGLLAKTSSNTGYCQPRHSPCQKLPFEPFISPWNHPYYNQPQVGWLEFRLHSVVAICLWC